MVQSWELLADWGVDGKSGERENDLVWLEGGGTAEEAADPPGQRLITPAASFSVLNERALLSPPSQKCCSMNPPPREKGSHLLGTAP